MAISPTPTSSRRIEKAYLLKVPHHVRKVNERAYEPQLISIGPYHHNAKRHLEEMEVYKHECLKRILERKGDQSTARYMNAMNFERARKWYSPSLAKKLDDPDEYRKFQEMMLLDSCFVVELLSGKLADDEPFFQLKWVEDALYHDLLLLENQLPLFVLIDLYHMIKDPSNGKDFACQAFSLLSDRLPGPKKWKNNSPTIKDTDNIKHLLSLVHDHWAPSFLGRKRHQRYHRRRKEEEKVREKERKRKEKKFQGDEESSLTTPLCKGKEQCNHESSYVDHCSFKGKFLCFGREKEDLRKGLLEWQSLRCAVELKKAGIHFKKCNQGSYVESLFDVSFTDEIMKIPTFVVDDYTERLFRNFIAYELYEEGSTYVIDYVTLMDNLMNSADDVQLLRFKGIIENMLGNDEAVVQMVNTLRDRFILHNDTFYYEEIFVHVKKHCARRWNTWKAKLRDDYFYSPWAIVSSIAALVIIIITIGQFMLEVIPLF